MIIPPYVFVKEICNSYHNYKLCKENKKKLVNCLNNYILYNKEQDCNKYFNILIKCKCC